MWPGASTTVLQREASLPHLSTFNREMARTLLSFSASSFGVRSALRSDRPLIFVSHVPLRLKKPQQQPTHHGTNHQQDHSKSHNHHTPSKPKNSTATETTYPSIRAHDTRVPLFIFMPCFGRHFVCPALGTAGFVSVAIGSYQCKEAESQ